MTPIFRSGGSPAALFLSIQSYPQLGRRLTPRVKQSCKLNSEVTIGVAIGARPVRRSGMSQSSGFVEVEVEPADRPGKLGTLALGVQSERSRKES